MPAPLQLNRLDSAAHTVPVMGIPEWMCYHANYDIPCSGVSDLDACLAEVKAKGLTHCFFERLERQRAAGRAAQKKSRSKIRGWYFYLDSFYLI